MRIIFQRKGKINGIQLIFIAIYKQISIFSYSFQACADCCNSPIYTVPFAKNKGPCQCKALKSVFIQFRKTYSVWGYRITQGQAPQPAAFRHSQLLQHRDSWSTPLPSDFIISQNEKKHFPEHMIYDTMTEWDVTITVGGLDPLAL